MDDLALMADFLNGKEHNIKYKVICGENAAVDQEKRGLLIRDSNTKWSIRKSRVRT